MGHGDQTIFTFVNFSKMQFSIFCTTNYYMTLVQVDNNKVISAEQGLIVAQNGDRPA
jgi:hypothetical protein